MLLLSSQRTKQRRALGCEKRIRMKLKTLSLHSLPLLFRTQTRSNKWLCCCLYSRGSIARAGLESSSEKSASCNSDGENTLVHRKSARESVCFCSTKLWFYCSAVRCFSMGTTGHSRIFAPNLSPLAVGAAAMGGGGLLQALLARKSIIYHLAHIKAHAVMLGCRRNCGFYLSFGLLFIDAPCRHNHWDGRFDWYGAFIYSTFRKGVWPKSTFNDMADEFRLGVTGVALLSLFRGITCCSNHGEFVPKSTNVGYCFRAVAGLTYALYSWAAKRMIDQGMMQKASMGLIFGLGSLLLLPTLWITGSNLFEENINLYVVVIWCWFQCFWAMFYLDMA